MFRLNSRRSAQRRRPAVARRGLTTRSSSTLGYEPLEARRVLDSTVVFNEVMYNPVQDDASHEWIELHNQMSVDMDVSGWVLADGVDYTFPADTIVPGGGYLVVAAAPDVLQNATGLTDVFGPFQRRISNAGERIELRNHTGRRMDALDFEDSGDWPVAADGSGVTLAKIRPQAATEPAANWSFSTQIGGTPGAANGDFPDEPDDGLMISEVTAGNVGSFWVELHNPSDQPIELSGRILASSELTDRDYQLPNHTLSPGEYHVVTAAQLGFQPQANDRLWLLSVDRSQVLDAVRVGDRLQGRSAQQQLRWQFPSAATPGSDNVFSFQDQIVINEVMYQARPQYEQAPDIPFAESEEEWIELYNRSQQTVDLSGWSLSDAVRFEFPQGTLLGPDQYLVVARSADQLAALHPDIVIVGEFSARLSDSDERIQLLDAQLNLADEVHYYDGGRWPEYADGGGSSLELRDPHADNARGEAWASSDETARSAWQHVSYTRTVEPYLYNPPIHFNEFIMGLIQAGEVWIDNLSVIESPGTTHRQLIQNGDFDQDTPGTHADKWRLLGTHQRSEVIADPEQSGNQVLRLVAEAHMNYLSNHAETTLA